MKTTVELPDDLFREAKAREALHGRPLKDLLADALKLLLQIADEKQSLAGDATGSGVPACKRVSAGAWARQFMGVARLAPGETTDDARMDHYREKYGVADSMEWKTLCGSL